MTDDLPTRLRDWWRHEPLHELSDWCGACGLRMPCDWNQVVEEAHEAADRIEELEAEVERLRAAQIRRLGND